LQGIKLSTHHIYYPRRDYPKGVERKYRNLPSNKIALPILVHQVMHTDESAPLKPKITTMKKAIQRFDNCRRDIPEVKEFANLSLRFIGCPSCEQPHSLPNQWACKGYLYCKNCQMFYRFNVKDLLLPILDKELEKADIKLGQLALAVAT